MPETTNKDPKRLYISDTDVLFPPAANDILVPVFDQNNRHIGHVLLFTLEKMLVAHEYGAYGAKCQNKPASL